MGDKITSAISKALEINPGWVSESDMLIVDKYFPKGKINPTILEIGTGYGRLAIFMANRNPKAEIYTIDNLTAPSLGFGKQKDESREIIKKNIYNYPNIHFIEGDSKLISWDKLIDLLIIDGSHKYEIVKSDFEKYSNFITNDGYILFHDYNFKQGEREYIDVRQYIEDIKLPIIDEGNIAIWQKKE